MELINEIGKEVMSREQPTTIFGNSFCNYSQPSLSYRIYRKDIVTISYQAYY